MNRDLLQKVGENTEAVKRILDAGLTRRQFLKVIAAGSTIATTSCAGVGFKRWENPDSQTLGIGWEDYVDTAFLSGKKLTPNGFDLSNYGFLTFIGNFDGTASYKLDYDKSMANRGPALETVVERLLPSVVRGLKNDPETRQRLMDNLRNIEGLKRELANIVVVEGRYLPGSDVYGLFEGMFLNSSGKPLVATVPFNYGNGLELGLIRDRPLTREEIARIYGKEQHPMQETRWHPVLGPAVRVVILPEGILKMDYQGHQKGAKLGYTASSFAGFDYKAPIGTKFFLIATGKFDSQGYTDNSGNFVRANHNSGYQSGYSHLSRISVVNDGRTIRRDTEIGKSGNTGLFGQRLGGVAYDPHLDLSVFKKIA